MKTQFISLLIALLAGLLPLQAQQVSISGIVTDKKLNPKIRKQSQWQSQLQ